MFQWILYSSLFNSIFFPKNSIELRSNDVVEWKFPVYQIDILK